MDLEGLRRDLLSWFDRARRPLPLREDRTPYRVLVAEVMSQQTRAETVTPYLQRFLHRFPTPRALAAAPEDEVLLAWQGLGYYRRAVHLRQAAVEIVQRHGGEVPGDAEALRALPGVGAYVAGAVASLAFGRDEPAVDANVSRVLARVFDLRLFVDAPDGRRELARLARHVLPPGRAGAWNEALMDLGATLCATRAPRCGACPLAGHCLGRRGGRPEALPLRRAGRPRPEVVVASVLAWRGGRVALRRRPAGGLLAGMWEFPSLEGTDSALELGAAYGLRLEAVRPLPPFRHVFTHRVWAVQPFAARAEQPPPGGGAEPPGGAADLRWVRPEELPGLPLSGPTARLAAGAGLTRAKHSNVRVAAVAPAAGEARRDPRRPQGGRAIVSGEPEEQRLDALLVENRLFQPSPEFRARANASDPGIYARAEADPEAFWADQARELRWMTPYERVLEWEPPHARWFLGGRLNVADNCLDRHCEGARRNKAAILWEGEPGDTRTITYQQLRDDVARCANVLKSLGVRRGDRVAIYMGMVPETAVAMLACTRIGAAHTVVFGGFSADALRERIQDAGCKLLITQDGAWRRGRVVPLKASARAAVEGAPSVERTLVLRRVGDLVEPVTIPGEVDWHEAMARASADCPCEPMEAEDMLYILYTSGTTGKPKGIVHTTAGYLLGASWTHRFVFDLKEDDVYWCAADIGWVTGHSYIVYGPLANGATVLMYEGTPDFPERDRHWRIIERHGVNIYYTAPTTIRTFMRWGAELPARSDLSTLRVLGSVGEPINPEAWMWYHEHVGRGRCPVVDTWWQTETGAIMIAPLPGLVPTKPGSATRPLPGIGAEVLDERGQPVGPGGGGNLVLTRPWPSMMRTIFGDDERFRRQYWSRYPGRYLTGDGAKIDADGYLWLLGRVDDVMNVSGHRLSTYEIESALVDHPRVAEAAVIGRHDDLKGQAIAAFVTLKETAEAVSADALKVELRTHVGEKIGPIARPDDVYFTAELPKTRSGKIMRRLLRDIAEGRALGDTTTLADQGVVQKLKEQYEESEGA